MIYATLHVRLPDGQNLSYHLEKEVITIGRAPNNDLALDEPSVAPHQVRLTVQLGQITIQNLGAAGGVTLDGLPLEPNKESSLLRVNLIKLGNVEMIVGAPNSPTPTWAPSAAAPASRPFNITLTPKRSTRDFMVMVTRPKGGTGLLGAKAPQVVLAGKDANEAMTFTFKPQTFKLESGESKSASLEVRGKPGTFTITATTENFTAITKGQLLASSRLPMVLVGVIVVSVLAALFLVLGVCPTVFNDMCGFVPSNPVSLAFSSATPLPTNTPTPTVTFTPTSAAVANTQIALTTVPTLTFTPSPTFTRTPTPRFEGGYITYKLLQPNGLYALMVLPPVGNPVQLLANKTDMRVLEYSRTRNIFAIDVVEGNKHFLYLVTGEGKSVREAINEGWERINEVDFAPDASYFLVEATLTGDQIRYFFFNPSGELVRAMSLQAPTASPTQTRTALPTNTSTVTPPPTRTP